LSIVVSLDVGEQAIDLLVEVAERSHDGHHLPTVDALLLVHPIRVPGA